MTPFYSLTQIKKMKNNRHHLFILFITSISFVTSYSQESIVTSGGDATGAGGTSNYSIGQITYTSQTATGGIVTLGVQQPYEIVTLGNDDFTEITLLMTVYPNPTIDMLNLLVTDNKWNDLSCQLSNINGKIVSKNKNIITSETSISMQGLQNGIYFLTVTDDNKTLKTFKIIKK
jgi:hypothetical protein